MQPPDQRPVPAVRSLWTGCADSRAGRTPTQSNKVTRTLAKALGEAAQLPSSTSSSSAATETATAASEPGDIPLVRNVEAAYTTQRPYILRALQDRNRRLTERRVQLVNTYLSLEETWLMRVNRLEVGVA